MPITPAAAESGVAPEITEAISKAIPIIDGVLEGHVFYVSIPEIQKQVRWSPILGKKVIDGIIAHYRSLGYEASYDHGSAQRDDPPSLSFTYTPGVSKDIPLSMIGQACVDEVFHVIDEHLVAGQRTVSFDEPFGGTRFAIPRGFHNRLVYEVKKAYDAVGWKVTYDSGDRQRDCSPSFSFAKK